MNSENAWKDWKDTRLAQGKAGNLAAYTIDECLKKLLPENRVHSAEECNWVIDCLNRRFQQRFIAPLHLLIEESDTKGGDEYVAVGFTIMAIASLMIETLACFRNGQWSTDSIGRTPDPRWTSATPTRHRNGAKTFEAFLTEANSAFKAHFTGGDERNFYGQIRCGILHQAETKGGWRIRKNGALVEGQVGERSINAIKFLEALESELGRYETDLTGADPTSSGLWKSCRYKLLGICVSAGWQKDWPIGDQMIDWSAYWP